MALRLHVQRIVALLLLPCSSNISNAAQCVYGLAVEGLFRLATPLVFLALAVASLALCSVVLAPLLLELAETWRRMARQNKAGLSVVLLITT